MGDLVKLVMAKEGVRKIQNVDEKLAHELADCLWSVLVLSDHYGVDLESAFVKTMGKIEKEIKEKQKSLSGSINYSFMLRKKYEWS